MIITPPYVFPMRPYVPNQPTGFVPRPAQPPTPPPRKDSSPTTMTTPMVPAAPSPTDALLTAQQVAKIIRVSEGGVRNPAPRRSPKLPVVHLGPLLRFRSIDIAAF